MGLGYLDLIHEDCLSFKWYEVWKSHTADRYKINNVNKQATIVNNVRDLVVNLLQPLRDDIGIIKPKSWFRSSELERIICEVNYKRWCGRYSVTPNKATWDTYLNLKSHPKGMAVDIEVDCMTNDDLYYLIKRNFEFDQLIREYPREGVPDSGWIHVSWAGKTKNRNQAIYL